MFKKLNKKRILVVCLMLVISIISFNIRDDRNSIKKYSVPANATPITNKVVILDAGHRASR